MNKVWNMSLSPSLSFPKVFLLLMVLMVSSPSPSPSPSPSNEGNLDNVGNNNSNSNSNSNSWSEGRNRCEIAKSGKCDKYGRTHCQEQVLLVLVPTLKSQSQSQSQSQSRSQSYQPNHNNALTKQAKCIDGSNFLPGGGRGIQNADLTTWCNGNNIHGKSECQEQGNSIYLQYKLFLKFIKN